MPSKIRKILIWAGVFFAGAGIMELLVRYVSPSTPNMEVYIIDSLQKSPITSNKLGDFAGSHVLIDSVSANKELYSFTIKVSGSLSDTTLKCVIVKIREEWKIKSMVPVN